MKDASGASQMDAATQVSSLYGVSTLEAAQRTMEANACLALLHEAGGENDLRLMSLAVAAHVNLHGSAELAAAQAAREAGNAPNLVLAAAAAIVGPQRQASVRRVARLLTERFREAGLSDALDESFDVTRVDASGCGELLGAEPDPRAQALLHAIAARGAKSAIVQWVRSLGPFPRSEAVLAAITTTLAWGPLMRKRISRLTAESLPWWVQLLGTVLGASAPATQHAADRFCGFDNQALLNECGLADISFLALLGRAPRAEDRFAFQTLIGLLLTNGPGAISAQGAKGAVSADGPESPERVQLNKCLIGFLTHCGFAHGGNGHEGVAFLNERFRDSGLTDPGDPASGCGLRTLAKDYVHEYARYRAERKSVGSLELAKIPGVHHPVFRDKPVNLDPREEFIDEVYRRRGEYNVFLAFYHELVRELFEAGVSRTVYCVNVDAAIAALLMKILWAPLRQGTIGERDLENAAFSLFLHARMLGCAAETDDHMNRGRNMDTRTPARQCRFVL